MKSVTIYTGPLCNFCDAAKRLLTRNLMLNIKRLTLQQLMVLWIEMISKATC